MMEYWLALLFLTFAAFTLFTSPTFSKVFSVIIGGAILAKSLFYTSLDLNEHMIFFVLLLVGVGEQIYSIYSKSVYSTLPINSCLWIGSFSLVCIGDSFLKPFLLSTLIFLIINLNLTPRRGEKLGIYGSLVLVTLLFVGNREVLQASGVELVTFIILICNCLFVLSIQGRAKKLSRVLPAVLLWLFVVFKAVNTFSLTISNSTLVFFFTALVILSFYTSHRDIMSSLVTFSLSMVPLYLSHPTPTLQNTLITLIVVVYFCILFSPPKDEYGFYLLVGVAAIFFMPSSPALLLLQEFSKFGPLQQNCLLILLLTLSWRVSKGELNFGLKNNFDWKRPSYIAFVMGVILIVASAARVKGALV